MNNQKISWAVFDYGGVLAEEGFQAGLHAIAAQEGLDGDRLYDMTRELIISSGYLTGMVLEETFWRRFREQTRISRSDKDLRNEILSRFILRPWMLETVSGLKSKGIGTAILSDQVNWLDELDVRDGFFRYFDRVYNSFHVNISKNDSAIFEDLSHWLNSAPGRILFIDDHQGHVRRARTRGLEAIHYTGKDSFISSLADYVPEAQAWQS